MTAERIMAILHHARRLTNPNRFRQASQACCESDAAELASIRDLVTVKPIKPPPLPIEELWGSWDGAVSMHAC
eukprot:357897-Alexandrium_andersonii.AAC.1